MSMTVRSWPPPLRPLWWSGQNPAKKPPSICVWTKPTTTLEAGYTPHIRRIGEEKCDPDGKKVYPARRWVVERTLSWLSRWRGLLIRWDKKADNYLAMLKLACGLLWYRRWRKLTADF